MRRSFRFKLALRWTLTLLVGLVAICLLTFLVLRKSLDDQLNASLLNVASIQAASVTHAATGEMRFHEWELTPDEAAQIRELNRFAQVWTVGGASLLRTRYITEDLPLDRTALDAAASGRLSWSEQHYQDMRVRSLYYPLSRFGPAHGPHVLQVAAPLENRDRLLRRAALLLLGITLLVCTATFAGSWWLAERAIRPVREITDHATRIEAGTLDHRISAYAENEEYRGLVEVLNTMLARLHGAFEAQRRFTADASHELRSPLTALRGELELARRRRREPEEYERVLDSALEEVDRITRLTEDLLTLARSDARALRPEWAAVNVGDLVREVASRLRADLVERGQSLRISEDGAAHTIGDAELLSRLLWNLLTNAIKFTPAGGEVAVRTAQEDGHVIVEVADQGPGIPQEDLPRVFDRFYQVTHARTPGAWSGTGLGLSIARAIADLHSATLAAHNRPEGGAIFRLSLPAGKEPVTT